MPAPIRSLHDLYVIGETVVIPVPEEQWEKPGEAEWVTVYVQKLDPLDHDEAIRRGKAARARQRALLRDENSDDYLALVDMVEQMEQEQLIDVCVAKEETELLASARAEKIMGEDSDWAKDGYLEGLLDDWVTNDLQARLLEDPEDPDAKLVFTELARFDEELMAEVRSQRQDLRDMLLQLDDKSLRDKALDEILKRNVDQAFLAEFTRCEIWLATRKPCRRCLVTDDAGTPAPEPHQSRHAEVYFAGRPEVQRLEGPVLIRLQNAYQRVSVDPTEGKGLRATRTSSESSEPSEQEATEPSSGQLAAVG